VHLILAVVVALAALTLIVAILVDSFETIILPRRVRRRRRITVYVYYATWRPWSYIARRIEDTGRREDFLSFYGPLALILLLGVWAVGLVFGFAMLQWAFGSHLAPPAGHAGFSTDVYMSGTTFFTLGLGDVTPQTRIARALTVAEAGTGFAFLALVIGYLPILYQAFSRREVNISQLDARAGSPPSAVEMLRRFRQDGRELNAMLRDWEQWSAELLESHLSYPWLAHFRSQHERQSWVASLAVILDVCALVMVGIEGIPQQQARLTFAMARHAAVDLTQVLDVHKRIPAKDRLPPTELARLRAALEEVGMQVREGVDADARLASLRRLYEPYVNALSDELFSSLPMWIPAEGAPDDWETSPEE
jgi:hypothetical protein